VIRRIEAIFSIVVGVSVIGMWTMTLITGGISEKPVEISLH
jgi:hypothetical protein